MVQVFPHCQFLPLANIDKIQIFRRGGRGGGRPSRWVCLGAYPSAEHKPHPEKSVKSAGHMACVRVYMCVCVCVSVCDLYF